MTRFFLILLQSNPFESQPRIGHVDWIALSLLLSGLILLMILHYRNPSAINSMLSRSFRETTKKLYFATAAIDSIDKLLFSLIYVVSGALCVHFLFNELLDGLLQYTAYFLPVYLLLVLFVPMRFVAFVSGFEKPVAKIVKRQMPVIYLTGIVLLLVGVLLFLKIDLGSVWNWTFLGALVLFYLWIHIRIVQDLILEQISIIYIFMYFCTLEILPLFIFWVWISRH
jgi:hypothetical protein